MNDPADAITPGHTRRLSRAQSLVASLAPWRLLFGPVFQKEMRVSGRKLGVYFARSLYALVLALVISIAFVAAAENTSFSDSPSARIQSLQTIAPAIVVAMLWFQFFAMLLLAPVMTGGSICDEIRAQTLPTLLTTPLTALEIVCSKISSRITHLILLLLLSLPILLGVRLFGGVRAETVIAGAALAISVAVLAASIGVLTSTLSSRGATATLFAYILIAALLIAPPLLIWRYNEFVNEVYPPSTRLSDLLGPWAPAWPLDIPDWAFPVLNPVAALFVVSADPGTAGRIASRNVWIASSCVTLAVSLVALLTASATVRRVMRTSATGAPRRRRRKRKHAAQDTEHQQSPPVHVETRRSRDVSDRPVLWREIRQPLFNRTRTLAFAVAAVVLIAAIVYSSADADEEGVAFIPVSIGLVLLVLQAAILSSSGFSSEREARTLDALLTTRLAPAEMVWGKWIGAVRRQWFIPAVLACHVAILAAVGAVHWAALVHLPIAMAGPIIMLAGTGVFFGLRFRKSVTAAAVNLSLALGVWLACPILVGVLFGMLNLGGYEFGELAASVTLLSNPVAFGIFAVAMAHKDSGEPLLEIDYDFPGGDIEFVLFTMLVLFSAGVQIAVGLGAVALATARFKQYTGRTS